MPTVWLHICRLSDNLSLNSTGFGILGGGSRPALGTFSEYVVVEREQVIIAPDHLDDVHLAAWPLGGVTAWRSVLLYP